MAGGAGDKVRWPLASCRPNAAEMSIAATFACKDMPAWALLLQSSPGEGPATVPEVTDTERRLQGWLPWWLALDGVSRRLGDGKLLTCGNPTTTSPAALPAVLPV
jgi:hypothetical protein